MQMLHEMNQKHDGEHDAEKIVSTQLPVVLLILQNGGRLTVCWITEGWAQAERKVGIQQ